MPRSFSNSHKLVAAMLSVTLINAAQADTDPLPNATQQSLLEWTIEGLSSLNFQPVPDNPAGVVPLKRSGTLGSAGLFGTRRILMFGDLHGVNQHVVPVVDANVKQIFTRADLVIGNLESPITPDVRGNGDQAFNFHMTQTFVQGITTKLGISPGKQVYSVANNHSNDIDLNSLTGKWPTTLSSVDDLEGQGYKFTGIDQNILDTPAVTVVDLNGMRVGVLGWTHVENRDPPALYRPWLTEDRAMYKPDWLLRPQPRDFVSLKSSLNLKFLIGMPHWDLQFHSFPSSETVAQANLLMSRGMDLVAGAHQSTPQPIITGTTYMNKKSITFFGLHQLYTSPGSNWYEPLLSLVAELRVNTEGQLVSHEVIPLIRRTINPAPLESFKQCGISLASSGAELIKLDRLRCEVEKIKALKLESTPPYSKMISNFNRFEAILTTVYPLP